MPIGKVTFIDTIAEWYLRCFITGWFIHREPVRAVHNLHWRLLFTADKEDQTGDQKSHDRSLQYPYSSHCSGGKTYFGGRLKMAAPHVVSPITSSRRFLSFSSLVHLSHQAWLIIGTRVSSPQFTHFTFFVRINTPYTLLGDLDLNQK